MKSTVVNKEKTPLVVLKQEASMIKGGGYVDARTSQTTPHRANTKKKLVWVRGVVCLGTQTRTLSVVV